MRMRRSIRQGESPPETLIYELPRQMTSVPEGRTVRMQFAPAETVTLLYAFTRGPEAHYATPDELDATRAEGERLRILDQAEKARGVLTSTDYVESKARRTKRTISAAWDEWREKLAAIANGSGEEIPPEPGRWAELEASPPPSPAVVALEGMEALETDLTRLQAKIDEVRAGKQEMTPDELLQMYRDEPPGAAGKLEDAVRALKGEARRKLSELLNVELAELKNLRGMAGEDRVREQQIEYLLGLFTRLGEI